jgi:RNA polymerase primary sigma factor
MKNTRHYLSQTQEYTLYFNDVKKHKILTIDEEKQIYKRIVEAIKENKKDTERKLKDKLINSNLRYVIVCAKEKKNSSHNLTLMDLIQEGNIGLIKAVDRYDYVGMQDQRFLTYAVHWIRQSISEAIQKVDAEIRLPVNQMNAKAKYNSIDIKEEERLDYDSNKEKYEQQIDIKLEVNNLARVTNDLFDPIGGSNGGETTLLCDVLEDINSPRPDEYLDNLESNIKYLLDNMKDKLTTREKVIIECYFGIGMSESMTLEMIAEDLGLTKERVRQIKETAIKKLRDKALPLLNLCF